MVLIGASIIFQLLGGKLEPPACRVLHGRLVEKVPEAFDQHRARYPDPARQSIHVPALRGRRVQPLERGAGHAAVFIRNTLAPQLGIRVDSVHAEVRRKGDFRGLLAMANTIPDLSDLEINIQIQSPESAEKVQRLYQAWLERCPVYLALTKPMAIKTTLMAPAS